MNNIIPETPKPAIIEQQKLSWEELVSQGMVAREKKDGSQWELGDIALMAAKNYGADAIGKLAIEIGVRKNSLKVYRNVAKIFKKDIRISFSRLSFSHFQICASQDLPNKWLQLADTNNWTCEVLSKKIGGKPKKEYNIEDLKLSFNNLIKRAKDSLDKTEYIDFVLWISWELKD